MVWDLAREGEFSVVAVDGCEEALRPFEGIPNIEIRLLDLSDPRVVRDGVAGVEWAIGAVPGFLGFQTLRAVIEAGVHCVDISFFAEDPEELDALAKEKGVLAAVDCGVAPGLTNVLAGHMASQWDCFDRFVCGVGGLPQIRTLPWEYKAPFSPTDVLEIYTRPVRTIEGGRIVTRPPLVDVETLEFPGIGTVEAFPTDGLRTLLKNPLAPEMRELTLRYPGHVSKIRFLRDLGLLSSEPVPLPGGRSVAPLDVTSAVLFSSWMFHPGEEDLTLFFAHGEGRLHGKRTSSRFFFLDRFDKATQTSSMARTTGYTATAILRYLTTHFSTLQPGVLAPEQLGQDPKAFAFLKAYLKNRGIVFTEEHSEI
jgi:saccharopine dehydrogenase-like NADP-dependent oxidoreductase